MQTLEIGSNAARNYYFDKKNDRSYHWDKTTKESRSAKADKKRKPFAFDLANEEVYIHELGEDYRERFYEEAEYYAKESFGKVPRVIYEHEIVINDDGYKQLQVKGTGKSALESYLIPAYDESLPDWQRTRAFRDHTAFKTLEEQLQTATIGDIFIAPSPTAFEVPFEERKKWMFGNHSFLTWHQLVEENGKPKLVSRALRHYLNYDQQAELYKKLTGTYDPNGMLVGQLAKLQEGLNITDVTDSSQMFFFENSLRDIYKETPEHLKVPLDYDDKIEKTNEQMDEYLKIAQPLLDWVFTAIKEKYYDKGTVLQVFQSWETLIKQMVADEKIDKKYFANLSTDEIESQLDGLIDGYAISMPFMNLLSTDYTVSANSCGYGSGYGAGPMYNSNFVMTGSMDYLNLSYNSKLIHDMETNRYESYPCPHRCGTVIEGEIKGSKPITWKTRCPGCNQELPRCTEKASRE